MRRRVRRAVAISDFVAGEPASHRTDCKRGRIAGTAESPTLNLSRRRPSVYLAGILRDFLRCTAGVGRVLDYRESWSVIREHMGPLLLDLHVVHHVPSLGLRCILLMHHL